jgi:hypothetical protein
MLVLSAVPFTFADHWQAAHRQPPYRSGTRDDAIRREMG